jgi:hypothetical protein
MSQVNRKASPWLARARRPARQAWRPSGWRSSGSGGNVGSCPAGRCRWLIVGCGAHCVTTRASRRIRQRGWRPRAGDGRSPCGVGPAPAGPPAHAERARRRRLASRGTRDTRIPPSPGTSQYPGRRKLRP